MPKIYCIFLQNVIYSDCKKITGGSFMNEVIKNIKTRHSVRKFKSDSVEKSLIAEITE